MEIELSKLCIKYKLTDSEEEVLTFIVKNIENIENSSIRSISKMCYCSTTVVMNLAKKLKYKGFSEMTLKLKEELLGNKDNLNKSNSFLHTFSDFSEEKKEEFIKILTQHKKEAIYIIGSGFCEPIAKYIQDKLMLLRFHSFFTWHKENYINPHTENPLLICISKSGETSYITDLAGFCKNNNYSIISFTNNKTSTLKNVSTVSFSLFDSALLCEGNSMSNSFYPNALFLFEYLIGCYLEHHKLEIPDSY
ncbi:MAG: MurR/RpiR family transcriptional regulator [Cetobacterium sp.]